MDKEVILTEIRRCAAENDGRPLGRARFMKVTGIREADWSGKHWVRWSDAIREAGFDANAFNPKFDDDLVLAALADLVQELGHFPVAAEFKLKRKIDASFPSPGAFARFGRKADLARRLVEYCERSPGLEDVREVCIPLAAADSAQEPHGVGLDLQPGFVYLMKSGKFYKVGRSNSVGRREYELAIQLPEAIELIHSIETDDAPGIENYWHARFADRRANGEWFNLTAADVKAFKRRRNFM